VEASSPESLLAAGPIEVRPDQGLTLVDGRVITLSVREFHLLAELMRHRDSIVRREDLYLRVWGNALRHGDRSIDVYVHKLRVKLEGALPASRCIHTHVGFGYRFSIEPATA
jgi:DNA-binding response OmpR family regulator